MANQDRKMATVREVDEVTPIKGADRIEVCTVGGWNVITRKGEFAKGDLAVYLEIDTFCPVTVEPLAFLAERGTKTMDKGGDRFEGHVLKTIKLRGVYSQGLLLSPGAFGISDVEAKELCESEERVDERIGVWEYERPIQSYGTRSMARHIKNPFDRTVAPVTDAERIQNCTQIWPYLRRTEMYATVKVDGTSMTMLFDSRYEKLRLFSHHREIDFTYEDSVAGTSYLAAKRQGIVDFCETHPDITVQYELAGPKIQHSITDRPTCFVFAVWKRDTMRKYTYQELVDNGWDALVKSHVPVLDMDVSGHDTVFGVLHEIDDLRDQITRGRRDEGVVFHVTGQGSTSDYGWNSVRMRLAPNMEFKAVSNSYLAKPR